MTVKSFTIFTIFTNLARCNNRPIVLGCRFGGIFRGRDQGRGVGLRKVPNVNFVKAKFIFGVEICPSQFTFGSSEHKIDAQLALHFGRGLISALKTDSADGR